MNSLLRHLSYGIRVLLRAPGFTIIAVITLALGIGANTAIFSVVNKVLLQHLPYKDPDRLVFVWETWLSRGFKQMPTLPADYFEWTKQSQSFESLGCFQNRDYILTGTQEPERLRGTRVSAGFFPMLGVNPLLGRSFLPEEDSPGGARAVMLSHDLWERRFGSNPAVLGRPLTLNGQRYTVVGVMPRQFRLSLDWTLAGLTFPKTELWVPLAMKEADLFNGFELTVIGRLKPGVSMSQAEDDIGRTVRRLEQDRHELAGIGTHLVPFREQVVGDIRPSLLILLTAVAFLLLIACANIANLLLARGIGRQKEIAIRMALGAQRSTLAGQLLVEGLLLGLLGGGVGILAASWGTDLLVSLSPADIQRNGDIGIDLTVFGFTLALSLASALFFSLVPAFQSARVDPNDLLKEGGRRSDSGTPAARRFLVVAELALALMLLVGAGLLIRSFLRLQSVETGFNRQDLITMEMSLPDSRYPEPRQQSAFFQTLLTRVHNMPEVQSAGLVSYLPFGGTQELFFTIEGRATPSLKERPIASNRMISPEYFNIMGIPLIGGRLFNDRDLEGSPGVIIVDQEMARRYWPGEDPVGKRVMRGDPKSGLPWLTVVGVVGAIRQYGLDAEIKPGTYMPYTQAARSAMTLVIRTRADVSTIAGAVRKEVRSIDPGQPVDKVRRIEDVVAGSVAARRFSMILLTAFACVAVIMASAGIYGVISYSVSRRVHDMGVRMALGACPRQILRMALAEGVVLTVAGTAFGLAGAYTAAPLLRNLLWGVTASDLLVFTGVPVFLAIITFVACYFPARRATRIDPMEALRSE